MAVGKWEPTWHYTVPDGVHKGKTLYSGRYCGVTSVIIAIEDDKMYLLINKRGKGISDYQNLWNLPGGFLNNGESATEACSRETAEECGVAIPSHLFKLFQVLTDPAKCNNGNVSLRHICFLEERLPFNALQEGGEQDEVEGIQWIPLQDVNKLNWAFAHKELLLDYIIPNISMLYLSYLDNSINVLYD